MSFRDFVANMSGLRTHGGIGHVPRPRSPHPDPLLNEERESGARAMKVIPP